MAKDLFKGSEIVCKALIKEGVNVVFGIPGGAILPLYGTLNNFPEIKHILTRHEQADINEADGYSRKNGKVVFAFDT